MNKRSLKLAAMAALVGSVCQFGCLGSGFLSQLLRTAAVSTAIEFVLDNDAVFDLFEGGAVTP